MRLLGFQYAPESCELAMSNAATKLVEYVEGDKQPALELFKAICFFDPCQLPLCQNAEHLKHTEH